MKQYIILTLTPPIEPSNGFGSEGDRNGNGGYNLGGVEDWHQRKRYNDRKREYQETL